MRVPRSDRALGGGTAPRLAAWFVIAAASLGALSACDFHEPTGPGTVFTLEVIPGPVTLPVHGTQQFVAVGRDADGIEIEISPTWSVENGGGTINQTGGFTAGSTPGTFTGTVQATSGGHSATATVTVVVGALASITVTPDPETLAVNETQQFTAVGRDVAGNVVEISPTWSIENDGGTINGSGMFTAGTTPGTYSGTVTATSGGISADATVIVTAGPLASITVTPDPVALLIDATQQFTAVGRDGEGNVVEIDPVWTVENGGGTISASGVFTASNAPGEYVNTVRATAGGMSDEATVTVLSGALASITVTPDPVTLPINGIQQFTAVGRDSGGNVIPISPTWSVQNGGGTIDADGMFTAGTTPGTYANTVVATSGNISGDATVIVTAGKLASITVTPNPDTTAVTLTQQFTAVGRDSEGNVIPIVAAWSIVNGGGTIDGSGLFTAGTTLGKFENTVRATSGGISGFATVVVVAGGLHSITVTPDPDTLAVGETGQFTAVGRDTEGNIVPISPSVTWSVVNGGGTIDASGEFTAGNLNGEFENTVRAMSGSISGFATVVVTAPPAPESTFRVLANTTVTCSTASITGDIGTTGGDITGCTPMGGTHYEGGPEAQAAYDEFVASYTVLEDLSCDNTLSGTLAGVTLAPGVHCFTEGAALTGLLTLNGPADGVWVIKVGTTAGSLAATDFTVEMAGGGSPCNVTWWSRGAATTTDSFFLGSVLATGDITLTNGTFEGKAWSKGEVTVTSTVLTGCTP